MNSRVKSVEKKIRGEIIRIPDIKTVVINLGRKHGIKPSSVFSILGQPEAIVDPFAKKELGRVIIAKGKVKASHVDDEFTIATTEWSEWIGGSIMMGLVPNEPDLVIHEEELLVKPEDVQPWKAKSEEPVKIGDVVEVTVLVPKSVEATSDGDF